MATTETTLIEKADTHRSATQQSDRRLARLGVNLLKYEAVTHRQIFQPIITSSNRALIWSLFRSCRDGLIQRVPDPCILTQIVTTRCNYSCDFCSFADSLNRKHNDLSVTEIEQIYRTIGSSLNVIIYSGGEPTLNTELTSIIEAAYKNTPVQSIFIISNAWRPQLILDITHRIAQTCPDLHLTWSLSIEGPRALNNSVRYTRGKSWDAWQNTIDTMEALKAIRARFDYRQLDVQLCTVCSPENAHLLNDWYETVRDELKPDKWNLNLMRRSVQMSDSALPTFDERRASKELQPFEKAYIDISRRLRQDVLNGQLQFMYHTKTPQDGAIKSAMDLVSQESNRQTLLTESPQFCCKAGSIGAYISCDGAVSACEEFAHSATENKTFGQLRDTGYDFQKIWRGKKADQYRAKVGRSGECSGCSLESQRNYPSIFVSFKSIVTANRLANQIRSNSANRQRQLSLMRWASLEKTI